jgi:RimJ/RimL family protein N-acetyltransferase
VDSFTREAINFEVAQQPRFAVNEASFVSVVRQRIESGVAKINDMALADSFCNFAQISGTSQACFLPRIVSLSRGSSLLLAVRLRTELSPFTPFVEVVAQTAKICQLDIAELRANVEQKFATLRPRFVRLALDGEPPLDGFRAALDRVVLACPLNSVVSQGRFEIAVRVAPELGAEAAFEFYAAAHQGAPTLASVAAMPALATLREAQQEGMLWEIAEHGLPVGYVVLTDRARYTEHDVWIADAIMNPSQAGRGVYSAAVSALSRELAPKRADAWLCGSIHPDNVASLRAAEKLGRKVVSRVYEIPML